MEENALTCVYLFQSDRERKPIQTWALICDLLLSRSIKDGTVFQLRQGNDVSLLCTVHALPHFNLTEEIIDQQVWSLYPVAQFENCLLFFGESFCQEGSSIKISSRNIGLFRTPTNGLIPSIVTEWNKQKIEIRFSDQIFGYAEQQVFHQVWRRQRWQRQQPEW